jgi:hypothetical protein
VLPDKGFGIKAAGLQAGYCAVVETPDDVPTLRIEAEQPDRGIRVFVVATLGGEP